VRRSAQVAAIVAFFALVLVGLLTGGDEREITATSFGKVAVGHGAVYDVLRELGLPVARSFGAPAELPQARTVWWIAPNDGCAADSLTDPAFEEWIRGGGTAVVFLAPSAEACGADAKLAGLTVPARSVPAEVPKLAEERATLERILRREAEPKETATLRGGLLRAERRIEVPSPAAFVPQEEWNEDARGGAEEGWTVAVARDGAPFALDRSLDAGRLVLVADARLLENRSLDGADEALVAVDLALALGTPWIDERAHGLVASRDSLAYLVRSPAAGALAALLLAAVVFAWYGAAEPPRRVAELDTDAPTLETYVASLAGLYGATRDHARVLERYREVSARRLRRGLSLPVDTPLPVLLDRLARRRSLAREGLAELRSTERARSAADLARRAAVLDRLVEEASR
jgi:hypothetical protein